MPTSIVASVMPRDGAELRALRDAAGDHADRFELRADRWTGSGDDLAIAIAQLGRPTIATVRPVWEGGEFAGSESDRVQLLRAASRTASHVDIELRAAFATMAFAPAKKILSAHDFESTPEDLAGKVAELRSVAGDADFVKLAVTPRTAGEMARLIALQRADAAVPPLVAIGMGEVGLPTRLLAGRHGAPLVYGCVPGGEPTAPGQPDVAELAGLFRVKSQGPGTAVAAIVGNPLGHSLSPRLHNTLLKHHAIDRVFVPLLASDLDDALAAAEALGIDALSVTLPFKEAAAARAVGAIEGFRFPPPEGAVNTLVRAAGGWLAANTDRIGFEAALARGTHGLAAAAFKGSALVLGAGGVARTVVACLAEHGLRITIASRTFARAKALAQRSGATAVELARVDASRFDVIVNATPAGMHPHADASPLDQGALRAGQVVLDLVYRPRATRLLAQARAAGAVAVDGLEMFLAQALAQFRIFTGRGGDAELALATVEEALAASAPR